MLFRTKLMIGLRANVDIWVEIYVTVVSTLIDRFCCRLYSFEMLSSAQAKREWCHPFFAIILNVNVRNCFCRCSTNGLSMASCFNFLAAKTTRFRSQFIVIQYEYNNCTWSYKIFFSRWHNIYLYWLRILILGSHT